MVLNKQLQKILSTPIGKATKAEFFIARNMEKFKTDEEKNAYFIGVFDTLAEMHVEQQEAENEKERKEK